MQFLLQKIYLELAQYNKCLKLDLQNTLRNNYLQKTDLSTMAYSLECRAPFLSREMVEWALKIPSKFKVNKFEKKNNY